MKNYLPSKETELQNWFTNFLSVAGGNLTELGLTAADLTGLDGAHTNFGTALRSIIALRGQVERALRDRDGFRRVAEEDARILVKRIQAKPGVSDGLKAQLGITVPGHAPSRTPPATPADVLAKPNASGVNALAWNKMGNKPNTQFVVLAKTLAAGARADGDTGWTMVGMTTRTRFDHEGVTPGVPMAYKVIAQRAGRASAASHPVVVYGG